MTGAPTGANTVPLGRRRYPGAGDSDESASSNFDAQSAIERARAIANSALGAASAHASQSVQSTPPSAAGDADSERKRRRKNRWGARDATAAASAALARSMSKEQVESYATVLRIDEITRRLKSGDVVPPDGQRSPSPPPTYNSEGKRTNTREHRYRRKLEEERMRLVEEQLRRDPGYRPPADFRRRSRYSEKVFIPVDENPGLNFIGLLIGPRGNTLKKIEGDSGTKISIRGRGSIKEGKRRDDAHIPGADEDLHCHVVGDTEEKVRRGVRIVREIIQKACVTPEGHNDLKRNQLRELAALNGTLRDDEGQACTNCGSLDHRKWECEESTNVTLSLVCSICGNHGHPARDCARRNDPEALQRARERDQQLNSEYLNLMAELGESVRPGREDSGRRGSVPDRGSAQPPSGRQSPGQAPWLRGSDHDRRRPRSPPARPLERPGTPPWLRRRPADHFYKHGFRDPRPALPGSDGPGQQQSSYESPAHQAWPAAPGYGHSPYPQPDSGS
ncbi:hypothetical protein IWW52_003366, partial [Coemansia sp. RSA 2704]